ncbi:MAG: MAPEG family protein [Cyanobacteriota bacterium]|nr:MAPEG family protein [Cyanobacteriota bacterium]
MLSTLQNLPFPIIPLWAVAIAILLIYVPMVWVAWERFRLGYNLSAPRTMFDQLPPYAQRAFWAHQNAVETFAPFAAAAVIAFVTGPHPQLAWGQLGGDVWIAGLSGGFLLARLGHSLFYMIDWPYARSFSFLLGGICTAGILWISLREWIPWA